MVSTQITLAIMTKRVIDCAACNPNMDFYINGKLIKIDSFEDYIKMYSDEYVFEESKDWKIGVTASSDGFEQVSFVNGVETFKVACGLSRPATAVAQQGAQGFP